MVRRISAYLAGLLFLAGPVSAFAAPGELDAVERHCGKPGAESQETSAVNGQLQRTLIYNHGLYLHFEPVADGWAFTTAWNGNRPLIRGEVEKSFPCFHDAMQEAAAAGFMTDPSIAAQSKHSLSDNATFGIPHLALIVFLVITLLVLLVVPSARMRKLRAQQSKPVEHIYRKPNLDDYPSYVPPNQRIGRGNRFDRDIDEV